MILVICDEISELEIILEIVIKKQVLRLSDLVRVSQPGLEFGFSFPVKKCILGQTLLLQNACFDFWRRGMEGRVKFFGFCTPGTMISEIPFFAVFMANKSNDIEM